jgi:RNA polymerase sigma factor (sigma-70 family)
MPAAPLELQDLLQASGAAARDEAWSRFVARFSPLLLHTARTVAREHDRAMDAYAHLLEQLHEDDGRRLKQYLEDSGAQFTTWLVIVARRLCIDFLRQRYGRAPAAPSRMADHAMRRRLEDLVAVEIGEMVALTEPGAGPDETLRRRDRDQALRTSLAQLPPAHRLLLSLRFQDDLSVREIAKLLRYPTPFHVYRTLNTVLADLRRRLATHGIAEAEP